MKISKIFFAVIALLAVACTDNNNSGSTGDKTKWSNEGNICGEWKLTQHGNDKETEIGVYISFNENNTFELYQRVYSVIWMHYTGTFNLDGTTLSGVYSDGKAWGSTYTVSYADSPKRIRLVNGNEEAIYSESEIPEYIVDEAQQPENVRSVAIERFL